MPRRRGYSLEALSRAPGGAGWYQAQLGRYGNIGSGSKMLPWAAALQGFAEAYLQAKEMKKRRDMEQKRIDLDERRLQQDYDYKQEQLKIDREKIAAAGVEKKERAKETALDEAKREQKAAPTAYEFFPPEPSEGNIAPPSGVNVLDKQATLPGGQSINISRPSMASMLLGQGENPKEYEDSLGSYLSPPLSGPQFAGEPQMPPGYANKAAIAAQGEVDKHEQALRSAEDQAIQRDTSRLTQQNLGLTIAEKAERLKLLRDKTKDLGNLPANALKEDKARFAMFRALSDSAARRFDEEKAQFWWNKAAEVASMYAGGTPTPAATTPAGKKVRQILPDE